MNHHSQISDGCVDDIFELLFCVLSAADGPEVADVLGAVVRIVEAEIVSQLVAKNRHWSNPSDN